MYGNLTYEQLKAMPVEQKREVLVTMLGKYKTPKIIASKIPGASFIAISNLIRRLIENKPVGRVKGSQNESKVVDDKLEETKTDIINGSEVVPVKRKYERKTKTLDEVNISNTKDNNKSIKSSIMIEGTISGIELIKRFEVFAKAILENKEYDIILKIEET
jgi:hypothetical protein